MLPAGSTTGPGSFARDSFDNGLTCPQGTREAYRGFARSRSTFIKILHLVKVHDRIGTSLHLHSWSEQAKVPVLYQLKDVLLVW